LYTRGVAPKREAARLVKCVASLPAQEFGFAMPFSLRRRLTAAPAALCRVLALASVAWAVHAASASAAARLYLSPSGSDAAACTQTAPCKSLSRGYRAAQPGQTVQLASGSYRDSSLPAEPSTGDVRFAAAAGATVSLANDVHVAAKHVELVGLHVQGTLYIDAGAADVTIRNATLKTFQVLSSGAQAPTDISFIGGSVGPSADSSNLIASDSTTTTASPKNILFDGVAFHDFTLSPGSSAHVECLQVWAADGLTIRNSTFSNCEVFDIFLQKLPAGAAPTPSNILIENTFFAKTRSGYYAIRTGDHPGSNWRNLTIRNNSFNQAINLDPTATFANTRITSNIAPKLEFYAPSTGQTTASPPGVTTDYNVWSAGTKIGAHDQTAPTGYRNPTTGDYHLTPGAAAIDHADPTNSPTTDIDGDPRPNGTAPDAGADELASSTPTPTPTPMPTATGPRSSRARATLSPSADATISKGEPSRRFGRSTSLRVGGRPMRRSLLRFDVTGWAVAPASAVLRLWALDGSKHGGNVRLTTSARWSQSRVEWSNAPAVAPGGPVVKLGAVARGHWVRIDVTRLIRGNGTWTLRLSSPSNDASRYASREAKRHRPQLILSST
jgi:hypothetical protein